ncbi:MAG: hypothetical protein AAFY02_11730 [Pseudomonadota bacterium]
MASLKTYADWKHCITVLCGIPLTPAFVEERLTALRDPSDLKTQKFVATWGEAHRLCVIGWFEQAQREMGGAEEGEPATQSS